MTLDARTKSATASGRRSESLSNYARLVRCVLILPAALLLAACRLVDPEGCTAVAIPGVRLTVVDSISGERVESRDVKAVAYDGAYSEVATPGPSGVIVAAEERPGNYRIEVTAPGYRPWVLDGARVERGECHVRTVDLVARLQR